MRGIPRGKDKEEKIMTNVPKLFGSLAFNERVMKDRLPAKTYKEFQRVVAAGEPLSRELADMMAYAMKDWALEHGCTHYTHWFQPMTGITAESTKASSRRRRTAASSWNFRQGPDPGRTGRVEFPLRRPARYL